MKAGPRDDESGIRKELCIGDVIVVQVSDEYSRDIFRPKKYTPAGLEVWDPPGLPPGTTEGDRELRRDLIELLVALEGGRSSDIRLRKALRPLAGFGILHAIHEWIDMFALMGHIDNNSLFWAIKLSNL